jgi:predicted  nucleic acid-binding Zn-ribbon protein
MQEENTTEKFAVLEDRLSKILKGYSALKEEKEGIFSQMREREQEVERLRGEISLLKNERLEIRTRIERLIERLEGIPLEE